MVSLVRSLTTESHGHGRRLSSAPCLSGVRRLSHMCLAAIVLFGMAACGGSPTAPSPTPTPAPVPIPGFSEASFREAARITAAAANEVRAAARAGQFERDIKRLLDTVFAREGSGPPAFDHIVASGPNALDLHYPGDARELGDGELLLIDIGATSNEHCSDVSRTFPVSGRFTLRQLESIRLVADAEREAANGVQIGVESLRAMDTRARAFLRASPLRAKDANGVDQTLDRFFIHSLGHYVGRMVHGEDTGWLSTEPLPPGRVFTIEPGLYIASEGIGIRIEDTYLSTRAGVECLTCTAVK